MRTTSKFLFILTFIFSITFLLTNCNNSGTNKDSNKDSTVSEVVTKVVEHEGVHWTYEGAEGPEAWATLCGDYNPCGGQSQSPVDIDKTVKDATLKPLYLDYLPTKKLDILNNGHSVQVNYTEGVFVIENIDYHLLQFHFHCPSEYTIKGEHFPMEIHFVHSDADGNKAVIGIMVKEGAENQFLDKFWDKLPADKNLEYTYDLEFDINNLLPVDKGYYFLMGSLTTPPCSENVKWFILKTPVEASKAQIEKIIALMPKNNNRPVQPLNGREIKEF